MDAWMPSLSPSSPKLLKTSKYIFRGRENARGQIHILTDKRTLWLAVISVTVNCRWAQNWMKSETQPRKGDICKVLKYFLEQNLENHIWEKLLLACRHLIHRERVATQKWINFETEAGEQKKYWHSYSQWEWKGVKKISFVRIFRKICNINTRISFH